MPYRVSIGSRGMLRLVLVALASVATPTVLSARDSARIEDTPRIANPAAVSCGQRGGKLQSVRRMLAGKDYGTYTACVFGDNRWCEEWAMFRGTCPVGGMKITGYDDDTEVYCAITGGTVKRDYKRCSYANGADCGLKELYSGRCRQQTIPTASGIHYLQYPQAGLAVAYLKGSMAVVQSSGGVPTARLTTPQNGKPLKLLVDVTPLTELPIDGPLGFNQRDAEKERAALEAGSFAPWRVPAVRNSEKFLTVGDLKVKTFVTLAWFGVCSVNFERHARLYHGGAMVTITLVAQTDRLIADNPSYFGVDGKNCGTAPVWRQSDEGSSMDRFYADLVAEKVSRSALNWFYAFQTVIGALAIRERADQ